MPTTFNDVLIDGNQDVKQLRIQANPTGQTQPLQTWENSDGTAVLGQISQDGNVQLGDDLLGWSTPDALIEAHRADTSTTKPKRGFHSLGRIANLLSDAINWAVAELELLGTAGVSGLQTAFRATLTHNNSGDSTGAELRAGDFQSINETGSSGARVGQATGVRGTADNTPSGANAFLSKAVGVEGAITNAAGGDITDAAAFEVATPSNDGTITTLYGLRVPNLTQGGANYAIHTGQGAVHLGDFLELAHVSAPPAAPANTLRLYAKADNKLYTKDTAGVETQLGGSSPGGGAPTGAMLMWPTDTPPSDWLLCYGQAISRTTYASLFNVIGTTFGAGDGSTTFNLPDMRGRLPLGQDDMGGTSADRVTAVAADSLGGASGEETHMLTTDEMPSHNHSIKIPGSGASSIIDRSWNNGGNQTTANAIAINAAGGDQPHNNMPPYLTLNYIIKA